MEPHGAPWSPVDHRTTTTPRPAQAVAALLALPRRVILAKAPANCAATVLQAEEQAGQKW